MAPLKKRFRDFIYRFRPLPEYYGNDFKQIYNFLQESKSWDKRRIKAYKLERIKVLLRHAEKNVPYYRELFKTHGIKCEDIRTFEDFRKIPILTKRIVQESFEMLKADNFESYDPIPAETSATSGGATKVFRSAYLESFRNAVIWRFLHEYGYDFRDRKVTITAPHNFGPDAPLYEYDKLENTLEIDTSHLIARHYDRVYNALRKFRPKLIWSHPNMLGVLAEYALENGLQPLEVPLVCTFAMKFDPALKEMVRKIFRGKYIEYYGNRENTIAAWGDCDEIFFEASEYCHFEVETSSSGGKDNEGDLIATSLHNYAFPLIRYHSEDYVKWLGYNSPVKPYPAFRLIGGRSKDLLVSHQGLVEPYIVTYMMKRDFDKIRSYQFEQLSLDDVIIRVVVRDNYIRETDEPLLIKLAGEALPYNFRFRVEYVDNIPVTPQGKFRLAISPLALNYLNQYSKKPVQDL